MMKSEDIMDPLASLELRRVSKDPNAPLEFRMCGAVARAHAWHCRRSGVGLCAGVVLAAGYLLFRYLT
ncbi:hypothetical protein CBM2615_B150104 [Cupriavidus taiwanensis]|uniref:Uncharacterized protein n=1 Tax=Cupriavidus taiwanensis TaxID=164546 RepID=A0A976B0Q6_9BURK|nr:hypothetical protein CBM2614_B160107 [Cupriavidus taiwanensis]SOZ65126.1 hypothetical protein CBM2615_B150104 [Cupriavidus taiwanensis]SOZ68798.1 hypothetical protein CBM2613_B120104 [Cupriavidus taiwanensis]SPA08224.1 hypothetical protein CBM2625_B120103 [Cupriavidus taiwanensis]